MESTQKLTYFDPYRISVADSRFLNWLSMVYILI